MKVKRYFASTMRSALDLVKQEQGPDVLILSNRKVDGGVELITADELTEQEAARLSRAPARPRPDAAAEAEPAPASPAAGAAPGGRTPLLADGARAQEYLWTDAGTVQQMRDELHNLKALLESQLSGLAWSDFGSRHPLRARLMRVLSQIGICPALARRLVAEVPDDLDYRSGWHRALALLITRLRTETDPILASGGRVALLGPTGVGKSTLASKFAARAALAAGPDQVAIVSMDDRRLGAHQQMKAFGRLIGVPVLTARNAGELARALDELGRRRLVVIDTPGAAPGDSRYQALARDLDGLGAGIEQYNVLTATTDYLAASRLLEVTRELGIHGTILTKLDEAATLGPSLSAIIETGLPLAYISAGQRVPDDLEPADARRLIERAVELGKRAPGAGDRAQLEQAFQA